MSRYSLRELRASRADPHHTDPTLRLSPGEEVLLRQPVDLRVLGADSTMAQATSWSPQRAFGGSGSGPDLLWTSR